MPAAIGAGLRSVPERQEKLVMQKRIFTLCPVSRSPASGVLVRATGKEAFSKIQRPHSPNTQEIPASRAMVCLLAQSLFPRERREKSDLRQERQSM
jgi:hypothetical protein